MDEEEKNGSLNSKDVNASPKEGIAEVRITGDDLKQTLRKLKKPPQSGFKIKKSQTFSEKPSKSFKKTLARKAKAERKRRASLPTFDEKALSDETAIPIEKIQFDKTLENIRRWERNLLSKKALLITLKLIFYHGFAPERSTELKIKDVPTLPQDLKIDVTNYLQHLQTLPNPPNNPDSFLFPCYQIKELNPTIWSKIHDKPEKNLGRFLGRHQCLSPESIRELGIKHYYETLLKTGIEESEAITKIAKKFGLPEKKVKRILGWVTGVSVLKKKTEKNYWDEQSFLKELESRGGTEEANIARKILQWAKQKIFVIESGTGSKIGSLYILKQVRSGQKKEIFRSISLSTNRAVKIDFKMLKNPPFDEQKRLELRQRFIQIPNVSILNEEIYKNPSIPISALKNQGILDQFLSVVEWMITEQVTGMLSQFMSSKEDRNEEGK